MIKSMISVLVLTVGAILANAAAIDVSYTVSGSQGAWNLDFTVTNNMTAWPGQDVYQFGVVLSAGDVTGSPAAYDPTVYATWTNLFNGGGPFFYNNIWVDFNDFNHLLPGQSLSGFVAQIADPTPPTSVQWFAFSVPETFDPADIYTGFDSFRVDSDLLTAGFEGTAAEASSNVSAVPEPSTALLILFAAAILAPACRKFRHSS